MARGYCPNQECPNTDILDTMRACPTCGREPRELTPREYWRTRTIKMMHEHETAQISEIQEVARRALGEASFVPTAQKAVKTPRQEDLEGVDEAASPELGEPSTPTLDVFGGEAEEEFVGVIGEAEDIPFVERVMGLEGRLEELEVEPARADSSEAVRADVPESVFESDSMEEIVASSEAERAQIPEMRQSVMIRAEPLEEVGAPSGLSVEAGIEQPASPLRIITFREGGIEIGICPYCGRFIRGGDLRRHKLKCRVRNALGLQGED